jgi:hypothetical protein
MNSHVDVVGMSRGLGTCLDRHVGSFEDRLKALDYKPGTIKIYRVLIRRLATIMEARGVRPEDLTVELAAELVRGEERTTLEPHKCANIARRFTEHLVELGVATALPPTPKQIARQALRHGYEDYLRRQRGLSDRSIYHCWRLADRFLDHRFGDRDDDLQRITPGDIVAFLQLITTRKPPFRPSLKPLSASFSTGTAGDTNTRSQVVLARGQEERSAAIGNGFHPAIVRAHSRARVLSVTPGNSRRSSTAAAKSPPSSIAVRRTATSASVTTNIHRAWAHVGATGKRHSVQVLGDHPRGAEGSCSLRSVLAVCAEE